MKPIVTVSDGQIEMHDVAGKLEAAEKIVYASPCADDQSGHVKIFHAGFWHVPRYLFKIRRAAVLMKITWESEIEPADAGRF